MKKDKLMATALKMLEDCIRDLKKGIYEKLDTQATIFGLYMQMDFDHFVGNTYEEDEKAHRPTMPVETACFGEYYFNAQDIRTVVENLNYWYERYGSFLAVRQEVIDWYDHIHDPKTKDKVNLFHWLSGCPRPEKGGKDGSD